MARSEEYLRYKENVPSLIPFTRGKGESELYIIVPG
jgi:hypothetical protein